MEAKEFVLLKLPEAVCFRHEIHSRKRKTQWKIEEYYVIECGLDLNYAKGKTEKEAWLDAQKRLNASK